MASKQAIDSFLACRRIAVVGVSRDPKDFTRQVFRAFVERGYDAVPVNTAGGEVEGRRAASRVGEFHGVHRFFRRLGRRLPS